MVFQLHAPPANKLPWIMEPECPPANQMGRRIGGYTRDADGVYRMSEHGDGSAGIAQRMLLRYVLGYEDRAAIARRYGYSQRFVQGVITGEHFRWLTIPVRRRLLANNIGNIRMNRSELRPAEVRRAMQRLMAEAAAILRDPARSQSEEARNVSTDLWLLSGAWREDEPS